MYIGVIVIVRRFFFFFHDKIKKGFLIHLIFYGCSHGVTNERVMRVVKDANGYIVYHV